MAKENDIDAIREFMRDIKSKHARGTAGELTYRSRLENLISTLGGTKIDSINEAKTTTGNAVDITIERNGIAIGHLEAKDIKVDINNLKRANKNQFDRYIKEFDNLIYTNNLDWNFYRNKNLVHSVSIAEIKSGKIKPIKENYAALVVYLLDFLDQRPQTIKAAKELTKYMAIKTHIMRDAFEKGVEGDTALETLIEQREWIDEMLVKDITAQEFADMYAQTITYGLFVARLYSETPEDFSRQNIPNLLPITYPFLKDFFEFIASKTLGNTLNLYIDDLIEIYRATDDGIIKSYRKDSGDKDPFLHFYESFLKEYNSKERRDKGAYYTPEPVVNFIVRGVDSVLKKEFNLRDGLAHSEKTNVQWRLDRKKGEGFKSKPVEVHKVQILDPATGTGTFLAETIRHIAESKQKTGRAGWSSYVDNDLLPRLHGFESMMAPYVMAYLKLDMVLDSLKYKPTPDKPKRMSIYLTNSLTGANKDIPPLPFAKWLENEAHGATDIKDNHPIMCVIGNPPYNANSKNQDPWIMDLMKVYKKEAGGHARLKERNPKWVNDDYAKFIRMAQHMVEKTGEGVVGMITNHSYLDNPTFRGMRWHLMDSFDKIYILDLHGDYEKNKTAPDRKTDKNVFDIKKGVSIIIAWKTKRAKGEDKPLAQVFHGDLRGTYKKKEAFLKTKDLDSKKFKKINPRAPDCFFKPAGRKLKPEYKEYNKGFKVTELFDAPADMMEGEADLKSQKMKPNKSKKTHNYSVGIVTGGDSFVIAKNKKELHRRLSDFLKTNKSESDMQEYYDLGENYAKRLFDNKVKLKIDDKKIVPINYRPFDTRVIYFDGLLIVRPRKQIMQHFLDMQDFFKKDNLGLLVKRQAKHDFSYVFITDKIAEGCVFESAYANNTVLPLYLYPDENSLDKTIRVNMEPIIRKAIEDVATDSKNGTPDEKEIFDYIYGILHAPQYRERYREFLKESFPRIPYPKTPAEFWHLSSVGTKLREMHLKPDSLDISTYTFNGEDATPIVEYAKFDGKRVWINDTQYFDNVPQSAWEFYIGGRQTAREWLTEHEGQEIDYEDYQKIIAVLVQTEQTMQTIKWSRP